MNTTTKKNPIHVCQYCGTERKLVETIIDDEFVLNEDEKIYVPNSFTDMFEHTGNERCAQCLKKWTGF